MAYPTRLSFSTVLDGADLTVPANTDLVIGCFFGNPTATLEGVTMTAIVNQTTVCSIKKLWRPTVGNLTLGGGVTGYFFCIQNAIQESASGTRTGNGLITLDATTESLAIAIQKTDGNDNKIREDDSTAFTYSYNSGSSKVGYRECGDASMGAYFREDDVGKVVLGGNLIIIPYTFLAGGDFTLWSNE